MLQKTLAIVLIGLCLVFVLAETAVAQDGEPLATFSTTLFEGSGDCAQCHGGLDYDGSGSSFESDWRSSMMANAAKDPLWQAVVESEVERTPSLQGAIEDKCATCHMPMAHTELAAGGGIALIFGDGLLNSANDLHEAAMDGVSCALCHQIESTDLGDPSTFSGHFPIDTTTTSNRLIYGKYSDPSTTNMGGSFDAAFGAHVEDSGLCATCHMLYTTPVDASGNAISGADPFPEQTPYLEWEHSDFGDGVATDTSCQDCHMEQITESAPICSRGSAPGRTGFGKHYFDGGNAFMLGILRNNGVALGVSASAAQFNTAIARSESLLGNDTAVLSIDATSIADDLLTVDLGIDNLAGHKFPTGIPLRRAWVHLKVTDSATGQIVFESGKPLADGRISGNNADADGATYEPHYDLITAPGQVQIYEAIMVDDSDDVTYTLLRALEFEKDNRLLPLGFDKASAGSDIEVEGEAENDANFTGGHDDIRYQVATNGAEGPLAVEATLLFQPVSYAFVQALALSATPNDFAQELNAAAGTQVDDFLGYFTAANHTPNTVSTSSVILQVPTAISAPAMHAAAAPAAGLPAAAGLFLLLATAVVLQKRREIT